MRYQITPWTKVRNNSSSSFTDIERYMDEFFNAWNRPLDHQKDFSPACDITETKSHFIVNVDLPGVKKSDVNIEVNNGILTISGERRNELNQNDGAESYYERTYGTYKRSFNLPESVDPESIEANFENGVLSVALPKAKAKQARKIEIGEGKSNFFTKLIQSSKKTEENH